MDFFNSCRSFHATRQKSRHHSRGLKEREGGKEGSLQGQGQEKGGERWRPKWGHSKACGVALYLLHILVGPPHHGRKKVLSVVVCCLPFYRT